MCPLGIDCTALRQHCIVIANVCSYIYLRHDDVIKWKHFPRYWPFVRGILRSPVNSPHKGQWNGALMFSFNFAWINGWVNNREAGDLRRHRAHYDVTLSFVGFVGFGLGSNMWSSIFKLKAFQFSKNIPSLVVLECCCPHKVNIWNVNLTNTYLYC